MRNLDDELIRKAIEKITHLIGNKINYHSKELIQDKNLHTMDEVFIMGCVLTNILVLVPQIQFNINTPLVIKNEFIDHLCKMAKEKLTKLNENMKIRENAH